MNKPIEQGGNTPYREETLAKWRRLQAAITFAQGAQDQGYGVRLFPQRFDSVSNPEKGKVKPQSDVSGSTETSLVLPSGGENSQKPKIQQETKKAPSADRRNTGPTEVDLTHNLPAILRRAAADMYAQDIRPNQALKKQVDATLQQENDTTIWSSNFLRKVMGKNPE
jgi:hypothetical protein